MSNQPIDAQRPLAAEEEVHKRWRRVVGRRSFLRGRRGGGRGDRPGWRAVRRRSIGEQHYHQGDIAILRFPADVELIESDLWQQYNELGGVSGGNAAYMAALSHLDSDMPQYITDNTDDELSHAAFLNAYLRSKGAQPVDLDEFRTLPSSKATGARQVGRLTNLRACRRSPTRPDLVIARSAPRCPSAEDPAAHDYGLAPGGAGAVEKRAG